MSPTFFTDDEGIVLRAGPMPDLHTICVSIKRSPTSHLLLSMTYTCSHDSYILGSNLQSCRPIDRVRCVSGAGKCNMPSMSPVPRESSSGFPLCGTFWQCIRYMCWPGFSEEAREVSMVSTPLCMLSRDYKTEVQHMTSADLFRFVRFVISREDVERSSIRELHGLSPFS